MTISTLLNGKFISKQRQFWSLPVFWKSSTQIWFNYFVSLLIGHLDILFQIEYRTWLSALFTNISEFQIIGYNSWHLRTVLAISLHIFLFMFKSEIKNHLLEFKRNAWENLLLLYYFCKINYKNLPSTGNILYLKIFWNWLLTSIKTFCGNNDSSARFEPCRLFRRSRVWIIGQIGH